MLYLIFYSNSAVIVLLNNVYEHIMLYAYYALNLIYYYVLDLLCHPERQYSITKHYALNALSEL